jgi:hypothetical protein
MKCAVFYWALYYDEITEKKLLLSVWRPGKLLWMNLTYNYSIDLNIVQ